MRVNHRLRVPLVFAIGVWLGAFTNCGTTDSAANTTGAEGGRSDSTGTGGGPGTDGSAGGSCVAGAVSFHMIAAGAKYADYCVTTDCVGGWVSVKQLGTAALELFQGCTTTCSECVPAACRCVPAQAMKSQGETLAWNGTYFTDSICMGAAACRAPRCLSPGRYIATMCAGRRTSDAGGANSCTSDANPTCVDVEFDYPSANVVEGVIPL